MWCQADEKQRREEERREAETRHKKIMAEQFKADRRAYLEAQRAREEQQRKEEAEERKRQVEAAKEHVDHREALRLRKIEENRKKEVRVDKCGLALVDVCCCRRRCLRRTPDELTC